MQLENKTFWYDNLRVIATIGVIFIHVSSDYVPNSGNISAYNFWIGNLYDSASRISVPIFVMLSGALLLPKEYEIGVFLKKRLVRLIIPFLFWSLIYIANSIYSSFQDENSMNFVDILKTVFVNLRDGSSRHFWYIYMIIGLYLFIPVVGKWIRNSSEKEMRYFLIVWIVVLFFDQPYFSKFRPDIDMTYFTGYLGYLVLGYYLTVNSFGSKKQSDWFAGVILIVGYSTTVLGTYFVQQQTNEYVSTFYEPLSPNIMLFASGLFLLLKNKELKNKLMIRIRDFISKYSYGIFLVHVLVLFKLYDFGFAWNFINPILGIPVTVSVTFLISTGIVFVVNKLPFGKYISG
jgi:surface polysaccharide O-acyltransferase-like enzyme